MDTVDAFCTPGITPPAAFDRLRADLHRAADPARVAERRTHRTLVELRDRARFFLDSMEMYAGTGLGDWYGTIAGRLMAEADAIEAEARAEGVLS